MNEQTQQAVYSVQALMAPRNVRARSVSPVKFLPFVLLALPAQAVDFNREIRPILSDRCFTCHSPDEQNRRANFRLDTKEGIEAKSSKILDRISTDKKGLRM